MRIQRSTEVAARPADVWRHAVSMEGVNRELSPIRMSYPADLADLADPSADPPLGEPVFTSTIRVGPIPFDRHRLTLVEWDAGVGFLEDSTSILHRRWRHRRSIAPVGTGCIVTDIVDVEPRLPGTGRLTGWLVGRIFDRRHAVLAAEFGRGRR